MLTRSTCPLTLVSYRSARPVYTVSIDSWPNTHIGTVIWPVVYPLPPCSDDWISVGLLMVLREMSISQAEVPVYRF